MRKKKNIRLKQIGENIKKARTIKNLGFRELGTKSSVDYSQISAIERNEANLMTSTLLQLAAGLEIDPRDLLSFEETKAPFREANSQEIIDLKTIGYNIKKERKNRGMSYRELGAKSSVDYSQISAIEKNEANFLVTTLLKLADGLEIDPRELLTP